MGMTNPPDDLSENGRLRRALRGLVDKLDEIAADPEFKTVWALSHSHSHSHSHGLAYHGPNWVEALAAARTALDAPKAQVTEASRKPKDRLPAKMALGH
jgi:hypothetical protein